MQFHTLDFSELLREAVRGRVQFLGHFDFPHLRDGPQHCALRGERLHEVLAEITHVRIRRARHLAREIAERLPEFDRL